MPYQERYLPNLDELVALFESDQRFRDNKDYVLGKWAQEVNRRGMAGEYGPNYTPDMPIREIKLRGLIPDATTRGEFLGAIGESRPMADTADLTKTEPIGLGEEMRRTATLEGISKKLPVGGSIVKTGETLRLLRAKERIAAGTPEPGDEEVLANFEIEQQELLRRGKTLPAKIFDVATELPAYGMEFMAAGLGAAPRAVGAKLAGTALKKVAPIAAAGARTLTRPMAPRLVETIAQRRLNENIGMTPEGQLALTEPQESLPASVIKGAMGLAIDNATEAMGGMITVGNLAKSKMLRKFISERTAKTLNDLGYQGLAPEMLEERISAVLQVPLSQNRVDTPVKQLLDAIYPGVEQLATEAGAFGLFPAAGKALSAIPSIRRLGEEPLPPTVDTAAPAEAPSTEGYRLHKDQGPAVRLMQSVNQTRGKENYLPEDSYQIVYPLTEEQQMASEAFSKGLNMTVHWVQPRNDDARFIEGAHISGRELYLDVDGANDRTFIGTGMHEFSEYLFKTHPALYKQFSANVRGFVKDNKPYMDSLNESMQSAGIKISNKLAWKEFNADLMGDMGEDPAFWRQLGDQDIGLAKRIAKIFIDWIEKIKAKLTGNTRALQYIDQGGLGEIQRHAIAMINADVKLWQQQKEALFPEGARKMLPPATAQVPLQLEAGGLFNMPSPEASAASRVPPRGSAELLSTIARMQPSARAALPPATAVQQLTAGKALKLPPSTLPPAKPTANIPPAEQMPEWTRTPAAVEGAFRGLKAEQAETERLAAEDTGTRDMDNLRETVTSLADQVKVLTKALAAEKAAVEPTKKVEPTPPAEGEPSRAVQEQIPVEVPVPPTPEARGAMEKRASTPEAERPAGTRSQARAGAEVPRDVEAAPAEPAKPPELMTPDERIAKIRATPVMQRDTADVEWANNYTRGQVQAKQVAANKAASEAQARMALTRYTAEMPQLLRGKVLSVLNKVRSINGKPDTQAKYIERSVAEGAKVVTRKNGRRSIEHTDGRFMYESDLSKAALDYAEHLISNEPSYVRSGDRYVFRGEQAAAAKQAALRIDGYTGVRPKGSRRDSIGRQISADTPYGETWVSPSREYATERAGSRGTVRQVTAEMRKPLDLTSLGETTSIAEFNRVLEANGIPYQVREYEHFKRGVDVWQLFSRQVERTTASSVIDAVKRSGYDGIVINDGTAKASDNPTGKTWILLHSGKLVETEQANAAKPPPAATAEPAKPAAKEQAAKQEFETPENTPHEEYYKGIRGMPAPMVRNREKLAKKYGLEWTSGAFPLNATLTPAEYYAANARVKTPYNRGAYDKQLAEADHRQFVVNAMKQRLPVSAAAVEEYGVTLPPGYVRSGDRYVFMGEQAKPAAKPSLKPPAVKAKPPKAPPPQQADLSMRRRRFVKRMAGDKRLEGEDILKRPEAWYEAQNHVEMEKIAENMSDAQLEAFPVPDFNKPISGNENMYTIVQAERIKRATNADQTIDRILSAGMPSTMIAQLLAQYARIKKADPNYAITLIEKELAKRGRKLNDQQKGKLLEQVKALQAAEQEFRRLDDIAKEDLTQETAEASDLAREKVNKAKTALFTSYSKYSPRTLSDLLLTILQGNLLVPSSQVANIVGNTAFLPLRESANTVGATVDAIDSYLRKRQRTMAFAPAEKIKGYRYGAAMGAKEAGAQIRTGIPAGATVGGEKIRGMHPFIALRQAFGKDLPTDLTGKIKWSDRFNKIIEGTVGIPAETMLRGLSLGDQPFYRAAYEASLRESAAIKKLEGTELVRFLRWPDSKSAALADQQAREATFRQSNAIANLLLRGSKEFAAMTENIPLVGPALSILPRTVMPYISTPANLLWEGLQFVSPPLSIVKMLKHYKEGNVREAQQSFGKAMIGGMMLAGAWWLWKEGLLVGDPDRDKKRRELQLATLPPNSVNVSGLQRAMEGGDGSWNEGDHVVNYTKLGFMGFVLNTVANHYDESLKEGNIKDREAAEYAKLYYKMGPEMGSAALSLSALKGTADLLQAVADDKYDQWFSQWFRTLTALAVPNTVSAIDRATQTYIPQMPQDENKFITALQEKTFQTDNFPIKRDLWGRKIKRTPEGANPIGYNLISIFREREISKDPVSKEIARLYEDTNNADAIPSVPDRKITVKGKTTKLTDKQYEQYLEAVGTARLEAVKRLINSYQYKSANDDRKIKLLRHAYIINAERAREKVIRGIVAPSRTRMVIEEDLEEME